MRWPFLFLFLTLGYTSLYSQQLSLSVTADSAILINQESGVVLYEKNSRKIQYPASTTKIATVLYALKKKGNQLDAKVTAEQESIASISYQEKKRKNFALPAYWIDKDGSHMGIKKGEVMALRDLLYGAMVPSANDAANVIAQYVGGTIPEFMAELNEYLHSIGAKDTHFMNPHGLFHPDHLTTAYDMAILTAEALRDPLFRKIVSTVHYTRPKTNKQDSTTLLQSNRLLKKGKYYYPKAIGVKTGYTSMAQHNLVAAAQDGDRTLIAVLLKSSERNDLFKDSIALFEAAFSQPKVERVLLKSGPQTFTTDIPGASKPLQTYLQRDAAFAYYPSEEPAIKALLFWDDLMLPIQQGQKVGEVRFILEDNSTLLVEPIYALETVQKSGFGAIFNGSGEKWKFILKIGTVFGVFFLLGGLWLRRGRKQSLFR